MKSLTVVFLCALAAGAVPTATAQRLDYTGFWKRNCEDDQGLQIKPVRDGLYAISFCRLADCTAPGSYRPNSRIDGDAAYQVLGPTRIRLMHAEGGYTAYVKCNNDGTPPPAGRLR
jgi:hypothetical protein